MSGPPVPDPRTAGDYSWPDRPARLVVNVAGLRQRLGQRRVETIDVILAPHEVVGSRILERPVRGTVTIESIERGVSAYGAVTFEWQGDCRRCLEVVEGRLEVEIHEIFQVGAPAESEIVDFDGDQIDLLPVVRDAVGLSLPLAPLCRPECAGPDPERYPARSAYEADSAYEVDSADEVEQPAPEIDPRWAALDQLDLG